MASLELHDSTRRNLYDCVLAAGALLAWLDEEPDGELESLAGHVECIAEAVAPIDPVAAQAIRDRVTTSELESSVQDPLPGR